MRSSWGLWVACAASVSVGAFFFMGCASDAESVFSGVSTTGAGGKGGEGGTAQGGAGQGGSMMSSASSSSASSTASSSTSASSSSSGGFDPQACGTCAWQSCQAQIIACGAACQGFLSCSQSCMDKACVDACLQQSPQAKPVYDCTCASCSADCGSFCGGGTSSSSSSASSSSGAACAKCGDILQGSPNPPCQGSDTLAGALFTCTCQMNCTAECSSSCQGGQPSQACFGCVQQKCGMQLNACLQD